MLEILTTGIPTLISIVALIVALNTSRKDLGIQAFIAYTEKYHQVIEQFPDETWFMRFEKNTCKQTTKLRLAILKYFHLCNEEFYLWNRRLIAKDIWEGEITLNLNSVLIRNEWIAISYMFKCYPEFYSFVNDTIKIEDNG